MKGTAQPVSCSGTIAETGKIHSLKYDFPNIHPYNFKEN